MSYDEAERPAWLRNFVQMEGSMTKIKNAAAVLQRAEGKTEQAREVLHDAIREAHAGGESPALIAEVANLTRGRVYQIVAEKKKSAGAKKNG